MSMLSSLSFRQRFLIISILLIWLGFATRLHDLGGDSLWMDEMNTARDVRNQEQFSVRDHPPLLYVLITGTTYLFEESEFSLRLPSALAAVLAIPLLIRFGYLLRYPAAGLWAALLLILLPFHLRYAQEARHYSLLLSLSIATYLLLWLALRKRKTKYFVGYSILTALNLYVHYAALVVLASQSILIAGWFMLQLIKKQYRSILNIFLSAGLVVLLYVFQASRLLTAVKNHSGDTAVAGSGFVPLNIWLREILFAFSFYSHELSYLTLVFYLIGLALIIIQKRWTTLAFIVSGLFLPLLLIQLLHITRWAFPKYVIYMLPFYILGISITLDQGINWLQQKTFKNRHNKGYAYIALPVAFSLFLILFPLLNNEYTHITRDWRSVADTLEQKVGKDDIVLAVTMDMEGFNQVSATLPFYLEQKSSDFTLVPANYLDSNAVEMLLHSDANVWAVIFNRVVPIHFNESSGIQAEPFQGSLYLLEKPDQPGETFDEVIKLYEQLIPLTASPLPQCLLKKDLALLYITKQDLLSAKHWFEDAQTQCSAKIPARYGGQEFVLSIYPPLIEQYEAQGQKDEALQVAKELFQIDSKNESALNTLAIFDVLEAFKNDALQLSDAQAAMPVHIEQFAIPPNSEGVDVLLTHPPASVSFEVELPEEPALFYGRAAMHPESWHWGGNGSVFVVQIQTEDTPLTEIYRQHVSNDENDRKWHEVRIPLQQYAGQTVTFTLLTEPGPNVDFSGDWAGWESPLIMRDVPYE
jgi:hypothetical protein